MIRCVTLSLWLFVGITFGGCGKEEPPLPPPEKSENISVHLGKAPAAE